MESTNFATKKTLAKKQKKEGKCGFEFLTVVIDAFSFIHWAIPITEWNLKVQVERNGILNLYYTLNIFKTGRLKFVIIAVYVEKRYIKKNFKHIIMHANMDIQYINARPKLYLCIKGLQNTFSLYFYIFADSKICCADLSSSYSIGEVPEVKAGINVPLT